MTVRVVRDTGEIVGIVTLTEEIKDGKPILKVPSTTFADGSTLDAGSFPKDLTKTLNVKVWNRGLNMVFKGLPLLAKVKKGPWRWSFSYGKWLSPSTPR